ncbi:MAG: tetratricopeptide repeat protein, partial [Flavobacterium sp.]
LLAELAENACKCVDSINVYNKAKDEVSKEINKCIKAQTGAYQLGAKLADIDSLKNTAEEKDGKKQINIQLNLNENSAEYQKSYYEMERFMMANCSSLKEKVASNDKQSEKSFSGNKKALDYYSKGLDESKNENYKEAISYFEKAVKTDPEFAFAWDNMGICYRKLGDYDKALDAYKKSLQIDPNGLMPLQNIAIVYQYKKQYPEAISAYEKLAVLDKNNPEVFYGIGQVYALNMNEYEKGLDYICKAYNLYIEQKSPYRTDAEKIIQMIYAEMKKQGKEDKFREILKANNITAN